uniref:Recombination protein n=1 Tax=Siphoviridae sp. ctBLh2 TaxID=2827803 RepID=A0A8S5S289_9CAUD|nr:MAG TPA: recombination protein [Siphoviridae sp. ctBLh2]
MVRGHHCRRQEGVDRRADDRDDIGSMSRLLQDVVGELSKLPGVGRRTALRLAMHILRMDAEAVGDMTRSIDRFRNEIRHCVECNNLSDEAVCPICSDPERDHATICVVEQVADVLSIENTHQYRGLYHVLGGVISPMQGISPSDLKIDLLCERIARGGIGEVIIAISTSVEGETTLFYLMNRLRQFPGLKITSIARGIGFGDELEYVDELTITHALLNRREIE